MADDQQEKTEEATQQRRDDFRKRGQVAQTRELSSVMVLLGSALLLWGLGRFILQQVSELILYSLGPQMVEAVRTAQYSAVVVFATKKMIFLGGPIIGVLLLLSIISLCHFTNSTSPTMNQVHLHSSSPSCYERLNIGYLRQTLMATTSRFAI